MKKIAVLLFVITWISLFMHNVHTMIKITTTTNKEKNKKILSTINRFIALVIFILIFVIMA